MNTSIRKSYTLPILIIASLFFIFGFVTWINGVLIPFMRTVNELTDAQAYLVATASYISFVVMALPSSYLLKKVGYKRGMSIGLIVMGMGALVFIPAANSRTYWMFLAGIFIQGTGMTLLQTAANPYITILGPIESGAKRIALMGICNKVAGALGSLIFGALLLSGIDEIKDKLAHVNAIEKEDMLNIAANSVVTPYLVMAGIFFIFAVLMRFTPLPDIENKEEKKATEADSAKTNKKSIFQFPHLWLGVFTLFVYVGAEVIAGDTIIAYGLSLGYAAEQAKFFTTFTLTAMVVAYGLGVILIPKYLRQENALKLSALLGILFSVCVLLTNGFTSVLFVALLGFANAMVWPSVWPLTLKGLGRHTKTASALLVMAIAGGAIIPPLYGRLVDTQRLSLISEGMEQATASAIASHHSYWILLPCYGIILFFAVKGHKIR
ncbi:glucose/galactose transporter [Balneicella halophila]|uniref:Glucose/galactose transporter n=1 Tax=Balneicella halophila TaxID=1537566 RepID=A0A7L4USY1_BALHA|nr:sugar MFS transporter [Balneicella halophila]PVX52591.1 glucose/galactose transporter [Balneicella halophila]